MTTQRMGRLRRPAVVPQRYARSELDHGGTAVGTGGTAVVMVAWRAR